MRSEVTSRSNWAKDRSTLRVSRPIESWYELLGDRDKRHALASNSSTSLAKSASRPRQTVDLVDDDDINLPGADVVQQSLQVGAVGRSAEYPPSS